MEAISGTANGIHEDVYKRVTSEEIGNGMRYDVHHACLYTAAPAPPAINTAYIQVSLDYFGEGKIAKKIRLSGVPVKCFPYTTFHHVSHIYESLTTLVTKPLGFAPSNGCGPTGQ